jgi:hypothetical protein
MKVWLQMDMKEQMFGNLILIQATGILHHFPKHWLKE